MLGTVKNAALVLFCVVFLREPVSNVQAVGYSIALAGFSWYQLIKLTAKPMCPKPIGKDAPPFDVHSKRHSNQQGDAEGTPIGAATGVAVPGDALSIRSEMSLGDSDNERDSLLGQNVSKSCSRSTLDSLVLFDRTHATPKHTSIRR